MSSRVGCIIPVRILQQHWIGCRAGDLAWLVRIQEPPDASAAMARGRRYEDTISMLNALRSSHASARGESAYSETI
jgi:hypothetical protein